MSERLLAALLDRSLRAVTNDGEEGGLAPSLQSRLVVSAEGLGAGTRGLQRVGDIWNSCARLGWIATLFNGDRGNIAKQQ